MKTITERYQWLIDRFQKEFGNKHVIYGEYDYGHGFGIGISYATYRQAAKVEAYEKAPRMTKLGRLSKYMYWTRFSLNDRRDQAKGITGGTVLTGTECMLIDPDAEVNLLILLFRRGYEKSKA